MNNPVLIASLRNQLIELIEAQEEQSIKDLAHFVLSIQNIVDSRFYNMILHRPKAFLAYLRRQLYNSGDIAREAATPSETPDRASFANGDVDRLHYHIWAHFYRLDPELLLQPEYGRLVLRNAFNTPYLHTWALPPPLRRAVILACTKGIQIARKSPSSALAVLLGSFLRGHTLDLLRLNNVSTLPTRLHWQVAMYRSLRRREPSKQHYYRSFGTMLGRLRRQAQYTPPQPSSVTA